MAGWVKKRRRVIWRFFLTALIVLNLIVAVMIIRMLGLPERNGSNGSNVNRLRLGEEDIIYDGSPIMAPAAVLGIAKSPPPPPPPPPPFSPSIPSPTIPLPKSGPWSGGFKSTAAGPHVWNWSRTGKKGGASGLQTDRPRISIVVPGLGRDLDIIEDLIESVSGQSLLPDEVIVVMSQVNASGCDRMQQILGSLPLAISAHVNCTDGLLLEHEARNVGTTMVTGDVVSFVDSDDVMHVNKVEVVSTLFSESIELQGMWHKFTDKLDDMKTPLLSRAKSAHRVYRDDLAKLATREHKGYWVSRSMAHGWATVRTGLARSVPYRCEHRTNQGDCIASDVSFVRDAIKLKKGDKELLFIDLHMGWYVRAKMKKLGQRWGQR